MTTTNEIKATLNLNVGERVLMGIYHGAICHHYVAIAKNGSENILRRQVPKSVKNTDGTFSTEWLDATD